MFNYARASFRCHFCALLIATLSLVFIAGCGGGGGSSSPSANPTDKQPPLTGGAYTLIDLGTMDDGINPLQINAKNEVIGTVARNEDGKRFFSGVFLYRPGSSLSDGTLNDATPADYNSYDKNIRVAGFNDSGQAVGLRSANGSSTGCRWDVTQGTSASVTTLNVASATDISDSGYVIGSFSSGASIFDEVSASFRESNGNYFRAPTLGLGGDILTQLPPLPSGITNDLLRVTEFVSVNNGGEVVGYIDYTPVVSMGNEPLRHFRRALLLRGDILTDIGTPRGTNQSMATHINDAGSVVGVAWTGQADLTDATGPQAFLWRDRAFTRLGDLNNTAWNVPLSSNQAGTVVGVAVNNPTPGYFLLLDARYSPANTDRVGVVWRDGVALDLNTQIKENSGWRIIKAADINDAGTICAAASFQGGRTHAVLLVPKSN